MSVRDKKNESFFPLLDLPFNVETQILLALSEKEGGLHDILKLRLVCKITKSWVDNLPLPQAKRIFSNTVVKVKPSGPECTALQSFIRNPPPMRISSLFLTISTAYAQRKQASPSDSQLWERFYDFWKPRLESLVLHSHSESSLMEIDTVKERIYSFLPEIHHQIKLLHVPVTNANDVTLLQRFLDLKKDDCKCQIRIRFAILTDTFQSSLRKRGFDSDEAKASLRKFWISLVESKAQVQVDIEEQFLFEEMIRKLSPGQSIKFMKLMSTLGLSEIDGNAGNLVNFFPNLKTLHVDCTPANAVNLIRFPPVLNELYLYQGFPSQNRIPSTLRVLELDDLVSVPSSFIQTMAIVNQSCPSLEVLTLCCKIIVTRKGEELPANRDPMLFSKLKTLTFIGNLFYPGNIPIGKSVLLGAFNWQELQLNYLCLSFIDLNKQYLRVVDEEMLSTICLGRSGKTLVKCVVAEGSLTEGGISELGKLCNLAEENWRKRESNEGCRKWQENKYFRAFESSDTERVTMMP